MVSLSGRASVVLAPVSARPEPSDLGFLTDDAGRWVDRSTLEQARRVLGKIRAKSFEKKHIRFRGTMQNTTAPGVPA